MVLRLWWIAIWACVWAEALVKGKIIPKYGINMGDFNILCADWETKCYFLELVPSIFDVMVTWAESGEALYEGRANFRRARSKNKSPLSWFLLSKGVHQNWSAMKILDFKGTRVFLMSFMWKLLGMEVGKNIKTPKSTISIFIPKATLWWDFSDVKFPKFRYID